MGIRWHNGPVRIKRWGVRWFGVWLALAVLAACGDTSPTSPPPPESDALAGFTLTGDPAFPDGATWTYVAEVSGVRYDLAGVLLKPSGTGPFPAVIISHGINGNALGFSRMVAREMVGWGLVGIATNYTHASGVPIGSPGTSSEPGASPANVQRARRLVEILRGLGYVDLNRLALHGHSMGAFVTAATAGAHPDLFRAASHTAGGIRPDAFLAPAPAESQVVGIRAPYQMHHGDRDFVVPLLADQLFAAVLSGRGVTNQLHVYPGADHDDVAGNPLVAQRIRAWYTTHGIF